MADQGVKKSVTTGLIATVPSLLSTSFYFVDVITDFILTADYRMKSQNRMEWENIAYLQDFAVNDTQAKISPSNYRIAFYINLAAILPPLLASIAMCSWHVNKKLGRNGHGCFTKALFWVASILTSIPLSPLYILFTALRNIWNKFKHTRAANKNQIRPELEESEYLWGILKVTEAGTESSLQLVLQLWLLSFTLSRNQLDWSLIRDGLVGIVGIISNAETCGKNQECNSCVIVRVLHCRKILQQSSRNMKSIRLQIHLTTQ